MGQIIRIPRTYDGERCPTCWRFMRESGMSYKDAKADHAKCHGWLHCGSSCCGTCHYCGGDMFREDY